MDNDQGVVTLGDAHSPTSSAGFSWYPTRRMEPDCGPIAEQLAGATPTNAVLLRWAASPTNQPPQSWWDDDDDPTRPENE